VYTLPLRHPPTHPPTQQITKLVKKSQGRLVEAVVTSALPFTDHNSGEALKVFALSKLGEANELGAAAELALRWRHQQQQKQQQQQQQNRDNDGLGGSGGECGVATFVAGGTTGTTTTTTTSTASSSGSFLLNEQAVAEIAQAAEVSRLERRKKCLSFDDFRAPSGLGLAGLPCLTPPVKLVDTVHELEECFRLLLLELPVPESSSSSSSLDGGGRRSGVVVGLDVEWAAELHGKRRIRQRPYVLPVSSSSSSSSSTSTNLFAAPTMMDEGGDDDDDDDDDADDLAGDDFEDDSGGGDDDDSSLGASSGKTSISSIGSSSNNHNGGGRQRQGRRSRGAGGGGVSNKPRAAVLQLASRHHLFAIDISAFTATPEGCAALARLCGDFLADPTVTKLGFGLAQDINVLSRTIRDASREAEATLAAAATAAVTSAATVTAVTAAAAAAVGEGDSLPMSVGAASVSSAAALALATAATMDTTAAAAPLAPQFTQNGAQQQQHAGILDIRSHGAKVSPRLKGRGLSEYALEFMGKPLDKGEQCSDWSSRPLRASQLEYAVLDAWVCVAVWERIQERGDGSR
jgi:hypothetical protein